ncbi:MAG: DNA replication/repair protein RecF [bacterium]|nr:DNA replication/repair protein RecF [bacterium]
MFLKKLSLTGFRNYASLEILPHLSFNYLYGPNGAGKTNLLEAIYFLAHLQSFRRTTRAKMVNTDSEGMYISGEFESGGKKLRLEASVLGKERKYQVNGKIENSLTAYLGQVFVALFYPESLNLIRGRSLQRRAFFDRAIAAEDGRHLTDLRQYNRLLAERNKILKKDFSASFDIMRTWNERLIGVAAKVIKRRVDYLISFRQRTTTLEEDLHFAPEKKAEFKYMAGAYLGRDWEVAASSEGEIISFLSDSAAARREEEGRRGITLFGPHLDDFKILLKGRDAKDFASQGEQRILVILMVLAAAGRYQEIKKEKPIILLDDLSSELDDQRRMAVLEKLEVIDAQVFITSTEPPDDMVRPTGWKKFHVLAGKLESSPTATQRG